MRNIPDKRCTETRNAHFMFNNFFFRKPCCLRDNVEIYFRAGQATYYMAHIHCMLNR